MSHMSLQQQPLSPQEGCEAAAASICMKSLTVTVVMHVCEISNSNSSDAQARELLLNLCDLLLEHRDSRPRLQLKHLRAQGTSQHPPAPGTSHSTPHGTSVPTADRGYLAPPAPPRAIAVRYAEQQRIG